MMKSSSRRWRDKSPKDSANKTQISTSEPREVINETKNSYTITKKGLENSRAAISAKPTRIAKAIARAGLCSRREAERWIEQGRVSVNGRPLITPAFEVTLKDTVCVDGSPLPSASPSQVWCYHKPKGLVTTHKDPQGRPTVFQNLPPFLPRVISVGRLDFNTEGLLLLTNDGSLARYFELPSNGWLRRYRVRARGRVTEKDLDRLSKGMEVEGIKYGPVQASVDSVQGANTWLTLGLCEGKNREIRKILSAMGLSVSRLIRISFGPFDLGNLPPGEVEGVTQRELTRALGSQNPTRLKIYDRAFDSSKETPKSNPVPSPRKKEKRT